MLAAVALANLVVAAMQFGLGAAAPALRTDLGLTTQQLGFLLAGAPAGLMLGTYGWGVLADHTSERRVLAVAFLGFAASSLATAWAAHAGDVPLLTGLLLVTNAFGSATHSAGGRAISAVFPQHQHGTVLSIRHTAIPIGGVVGGLAVPAAVEVASFAWALVGFAALGLVVALVLWVALAHVEHVQRADTAAPLPRGRSPLQRPELWLLAVGCSSVAFVQLGIASFLTLQLVDEAGLTLRRAALAFAAAQLVGAAGRVVLGVWSDRVRDRLALLRGVFVGVFALVVGAVLVTDPSVDGVLLSLILVLSTTWQGVGVAAAASLAPAGRTGSTLGMQTTLNAAAFTIAPIVIALVLHRAGWTGVEFVLAGMVVVAVVALTMARVSRDHAARAVASTSE
ncbi:MAG: major facilitator superfamily 1 [Thermoleophilia bacterium]|nr:major facilitator superfamily 1 [Thermoleophilia bacterium]